LTSTVHHYKGMEYGYKVWEFPFVIVQTGQACKEHVPECEFSFLHTCHPDILYMCSVYLFSA